MTYARAKQMSCSLLTSLICSVTCFHFGLWIGPYVIPDLVKYSSVVLSRHAVLEKSVLSPPPKDGTSGKTCDCHLRPECSHQVVTSSIPENSRSSVPFNGTERRCIAFTLYAPGGEVNKRHTEGLFLNIKLIEVLYPNWRIKLFLDDSFKNSTLSLRIENTIRETPKLSLDLIWMKSEVSGHFGHFWRFLVADQTDCDRWIVRDVDCRLTIREMQAVHEWINSGKSFHIMRDHPGHDGEILAGLFGGTSRSLKRHKMADLIDAFMQSPKQASDKNAEDRRTGFWSDQEFLRKKVFPLIKDDFIAHDDFAYHGACRVYGNCREFPVRDFPFVSHWTDVETVVCSCKPRCLCNAAGSCPQKLVANRYIPVCYNASET